jgi:hypothetical protein
VHLFLELTTLVFFLLVVAHAIVCRGRLGASLVLAAGVLGLVRETFVVARRILYGYADLSLQVGATPVIGAIIWGYSIYIAIAWTEGMTGENLDDLRPTWKLATGVGLFMVCLVGFYEPLLALVDMARWQDGTRTTEGVPWIALLGYPSLSVPFVLGWCAVERRAREHHWSGLRQALVHGAAVVILALVHATGLQALKDALGW